MEWPRAGYGLSVAEPVPLRIDLLGGFRVAIGARAVPAGAWRRSKAAGLVKLLALAPAHRLHRERAMEALWPELGADAAAANLRKAVHYARRAVDASLIASIGDVVRSAALAHGDAEHARKRFEAAATLYQRADQPYWVERSRVQSAAA